MTTHTHGEERTREVTGRDATPDEGSAGDAGSGASAFGADTMGLPSPAPEYEEQYGLEGDPSHARDLTPDAIEGGAVEPTEAGRPPRGARAMAGRTVRELMQRAPTSLHVDAEPTVQDLRRSLAHTRYLPVIDGQRRFQGFVTRTDLLAIAGRPREERIPVRGILRTAAELREDAPIEAASRMMLKARAHVLPVVDAGGRLLGLLTDHVVLRSLLPRRQPAKASGLDVPVDAVMTQDPVSVGSDGTVAQAAGALVEAGIRHLPVLDPDGRVIGILSERDLRERIGADPREWFNAAADTLGDEVANVMTPDPLTVRVGSPLADAIEVLETERIGALPVVDEEDRLVGVLSYVDALAWMREALAQRQTQLAPGAEPTRH